MLRRSIEKFLSTPSGWRATAGSGVNSVVAFSISIHALRVEGDHPPKGDAVQIRLISIHALRVEGDVMTADGETPTWDFYPRPPGGGRHRDQGSDPRDSEFLSTPSGWRATGYIQLYARTHRFLSTPSGWRATCMVRFRGRTYVYFYPRPPGGGRLSVAPFKICSKIISIHALRVEGDSKNGQSFRLFLRKREKNLPL